MFRGNIETHKYKVVSSTLLVMLNQSCSCSRMLNWRQQHISKASGLFDNHSLYIKEKKSIYLQSLTATVVYHLTSLLINRVIHLRCLSLSCKNQSPTTKCKAAVESLCKTKFSHTFLNTMWLCLLDGCCCCCFFMRYFTRLVHRCFYMVTGSLLSWYSVHSREFQWGGHQDPY